MSARLRHCSSYQRHSLEAGWELCASAPGALADAHALEGAALAWLPAVVPGTVASSLRAAGAWSLESAPRRFDAEDWWYRLRFRTEPATADERVVLGFAGLASLAQVWLNGVALLQSNNMFLEHCCDVGARLQSANELVVCFRALDAYLQTPRPRPRWRTPMVEQQQLRWVRTSLLGRTPGWSPPAPAIGPWRSIWLERRQLLDLQELSLRVAVEGSGARVQLGGRAAPIGGAQLRAAELCLQRDGRQHCTPLHRDAAGRLQAQLELPRVVRWWPHTHGEPALYHASLLLTVASAARGGEEARVNVDLGHVGFRELRLRRDDGDFALEVNGAEVFCRGACWMPLDPVSFQANAADYGHAFEQVRGAGMNMLRVSGATVYEEERFLDLCDQHGVLLWQDCMFASMDYPDEDASFLSSVRAEVAQQLLRLQARAAPAILCGNSEVAQQAAMAGAGRELWSSALFAVELAAIARELCADVPYCPSSTHGGAFPHQVSAGVTSYYGVGAYQRRLSDARSSQLRFASECLAFANVPEAATLDRIGGAALRVHHPRWKERVPRDLGAGWDFDDIRDHYLAELFALDPQQLRYAEHERYLALSRVASAEVMAAAFGEWRRAGSRCRGALVWCLRDLWSGAGWGVIDATGKPKAAYYYLRRALQPLAVHISDEGNNGLQLHIINEPPESVVVQLELRLFRFSEPVGEPVGRTLELPPRTTLCLPATDLFESFLDLSYAFRFGPPSYDLLHVRLKRPSDASPLAEAFYFPLGLPSRLEADVGLAASLHTAGTAAGACLLTVSSRRFAQSVHIDAPDCLVEDQYFHLAPDSSRSLRLQLPQHNGDRRLRVTVSALNAAASCRAVLSS